jgi:hypothetical protein
MATGRKSMKKMLTMLGALVFALAPLAAEVTVPQNQRDYMESYAVQVEAMVYTIQDLITDIAQGLMSGAITDQEQAKLAMQSVVSRHLPTLIDQTFQLNYLNNWFIQNTTADQHEAVVRGMFSYVYGALTPSFFATIAAAVPVQAIAIEGMEQSKQAELIELVKIYMANKIATVIAYDVPQKFAGFESVVPEASIVVNDEAEKLAWVDNIIKSIEPMRALDGKTPIHFDKVAMAKLFGVMIKQANNAYARYIALYRDNPIADNALAVKNLEKAAILEMSLSQQQDNVVTSQATVEILQNAGMSDEAVIEFMTCIAKVAEDYCVVLARYHHDYAVALPYASTETAAQVTEYGQAAFTAACANNLKAWYNLSDEEAAALLV